MNRKHKLKFKNLKDFLRPGPSSSILNLRENKNARIRDWILVTLLWPAKKPAITRFFRKKHEVNFFKPSN